MAEQATIIRWENPPARRAQGGGSNGSRFQAVADQLRAHHGRWALIHESTNSSYGLSTHISMGSIGCFAPAGDFEAASRRVGGLTLTYARYVGDGEA